MTEFALESIAAGVESAEKWHGDRGRNVGQGRERETILKERSGNVYENKGSAFHTPEQSGDIIENAGSYESNAVILLKRKDVSLGKPGFRSQDSGVRSQEEDSEKAPPSPTTVPNWDASVDSKSVGTGERKDMAISKTHERSWNVYENKGSVFHSLEQTRNVVENTGGYEFKAGMFLKRKDVIARFKH
jgi:hypothetical protein